MERVVIWLKSIYFLYFLIILLLLIAYKLYIHNKSQKSNFNEKIGTLENDYDIKVASLKENHSDKISKLESQHKIKKDQLINKHHEYIQKVEEITSNDGEAFVKSIVDSCVNTYSGSNYPQVLHNVIFRKHDSENYKQIKDKFKQIDHLIISIYGLLAIETKYYAGNSYIGIGHKECFYTDRFKTFLPNLLKSEIYSTRYSSIVTVREYENKDKNGFMDIHYQVRKSTPLTQIGAAVKGLYKILNIDEKIKSYKVAILVPSELNYISEGNGKRTSLTDCRTFLKDKDKNKKKEYIYALNKDELINHIKEFLTGQLGDPQFSKEEVQAYVNKLRSI